jgi:hypothetical protein
MLSAVADAVSAVETDELENEEKDQCQAAQSTASISFT